MLVIDASNSIEAEWPALKRALQDFVLQLSPEDKVCIVTMGAGAHLRLEWTRMHSEGKKTSVETIRNLTLEDGDRNLLRVGQALVDRLEGLQKLNVTMESRNTMVAFVADGTDSCDSYEAVVGYYAQLLSLYSRVVFSCVAMGSDCEPNILANIARHGRGLFMYIPDSTHLSSALGEILASSRNIVLETMYVALLPHRGCMLEDIEET